MNTVMSDALMRLESEKDEADRQILWERYKLLSSEVVDYLKIVIQFTIFFYGITGAIMSFVLSRPEAADLKIAFLLPAIMGIGSAGAYLYFAYNQIFGNEEFERLAGKLFVYTNRELKYIEHLNKELPANMPMADRMRHYKEKGVDGEYFFRTSHALQVALVVLGILHLVIGVFSLWLWIRP
ncbi:MAG: hypothetical protein K2Y22_03935 [Candidatus Obscuribacterales bacterium]|nr:hypothetical protein [Candidatus Obscuribacterales bacterium]